MVTSNHKKQRADGRKLFHDGNIISAIMPLSREKKVSMSSYRYENADDIVAALISNRVVMEKMNPSCLCFKEEEISIDPQFQETWYGEILILSTRSIRNRIKNDRFPLSLDYREMSDGEGRGTMVVDGAGNTRVSNQHVN